MLRLLFGGIFIFMTCISRCRAAEPAFVISFSTQAPPNGQQFQSTLDFKQRVEAESHGQMRVDIDDSRELFDDDQIAAAVSAGRVEMGQVNVSRWAETILVAAAIISRPRSPMSLSRRRHAPQFAYARRGRHSDAVRLPVLQIGEGN